MKKAEKKIIRRDFGEFEKDVNLWNIVPGGTGKSISFLRNIVNATYHSKPPFMPRILLVGGENCGVNFHAKATVNSFCMSEIRETCCRYLDHNSSKEFFASDTNIGHLIYDVSEVRHDMESILWRFIGLFWCGYANPFQNNCDLEIVTCKGVIVLTAADQKKVSKKIVEAVDYVVELEPYSTLQLHQVVEQRLKYYSVDCQNKDIIDDIVRHGECNFEKIIKFLRICLDVIHADMRQNLTKKDIEIAAKLK